MVPSNTRQSPTLQLRRADGIVRAAFQQQTGFDLDSLVGSALSRHVSLGLISDDGARVCLTRQGKCVADALVKDLL